MSATVWSGRFLEMRDRDGWEYAARVGGVEAAAVLAIDDAADGRHLLLIEQRRPAVDALCLELPAGLIDNGETAELAAARELEEETGWRAATWERIGRFASSPGLTDERFTLLRATGLTRVGEGGGVEGESIRVHRVALARLTDFLAERDAAGVVLDARLLVLLSLQSLR